MDKLCSGCLTRYPEGHWASGRERCPACGQPLRPAGPSLDQEPFERYDSSADIRFDFSELLTPEAAREARLIGWLGLGLMLLAFAGRLGLVALLRLEGLWGLPLWLDLLAVGALLLGLGMAAWSARRLWRHRQAVRRR
ncbi:MAG TPA: hypothetical protein PK668_17285 [Myxococcota bacterium]|nr:hypothetical protein [Myxococcota bacterium]HRY94914.1 hypothetical protein [Myxococcota bacterium]